MHFDTKNDCKRWIKVIFSDSANIAIAGNPAKVVKEGIDWDKEINF